MAGYAIDDPRPLADAAPYTFHLPSENELLALAPGDLVKVIVRAIPASDKYDAERIWATVIGVEGELLVGRLDNDPFDIPALHDGDILRFLRSDVIDLIWADDRPTPPPRAPDRRWYWERCWVDNCVLHGGSPVDYLYRETPDESGPDEKHSDSGWRLRGTAEGIAADEEVGARAQYVALGAVLNRDDRWLQLIDSPIGSAFERDPATGTFRETESDE